MTIKHESLPPVIVLGGDQNALSVVRNLGRRGIRVFVINEPDAPVCSSRYCRLLPAPWQGSNKASWTAYLLSKQTDRLRGAVLLAASDEALEIIAENREQLAERYLLDESNVDAQRRMLDKLSTYQAAQAAGVLTPRYWLTKEKSLRELAPELVYPLLVKPLSSYRFGSKFGGKKFFVAGDFEQLEQAAGTAKAAGVDFMLVEQIPGPDDRLCSYYTYLDEAGRPLFDFTKRIIRRFPVGMGNGCYHVTDKNPAVREAALRLLQHVGLRGLGNVEFKCDERDGKLKLIECNARFTAADCLVTASGFNLASFVYNRLTGLEAVPLRKYESGLRLWYAVQDFRAFRELRAQNQMTLWPWLRSIAHRQTLPYWQWSDPFPSIMRCYRLSGLDAFLHHVGHQARTAVAKRLAWLRPGAPLDSWQGPKVTLAMGQRLNADK